MSHRPIRVSFGAADGFGRRFPARGVIRQRFERLVAPGILFLLEAAAGCALPLRFRGQSIAAPSDVTQPIAIGNGVKPRRRDDGLLGMRKDGIVPMKRFAMACCGEELAVFRVRHLAGGKFECSQPKRGARDVRCPGPTRSPSETTPRGCAAYAARRIRRGAAESRWSASVIRSRRLRRCSPRLAQQVDEQPIRSRNSGRQLPEE